MRAAGVFDDSLFGKTSVRADGRVIHGMYLVEVKKPDESKMPYDYYKIVSVIPGDRAIRRMGDGALPIREVTKKRHDACIKAITGEGECHGIALARPICSPRQLVFRVTAAFV
jgi:hypothetical protein